VLTGFLLRRYGLGVRARVRPRQPFGVAGCEPCATTASPISTYGMTCRNGGSRFSS